MKLFIWRHNRKFHSYSMIGEPSVHQDLYTDAIAIVVAESKSNAIELLAARETGWVAEELKRLEPQVFDCSTEGIVFEDIRGN